MPMTVFQIAVTARGMNGRKVFAVKAASEPAAERRLESDRRVPSNPQFEFQRIMSDAQIMARGITLGSIVELS